MLEDRTYRGAEACQLAGITYRQLDYWARTQMLEPSVAVAHGSGSRRLYSAGDIRKLRIIKTMLDRGLSLTAVRRVVAHFQDRAIEAGHTLAVSDATIVVLSPGQEMESSLTELLKGPVWLLPIQE